MGAGEGHDRLNMLALRVAMLRASSFNMLALLVAMLQVRSLCSTSSTSPVTPWGQVRSTFEYLVVRTQPDAAA
jgi:hypothetical protein